MLCLKLYGQVIELYTPEWTARLLGPRSTTAQPWAVLQVPPLDAGDVIEIKVAANHSLRRHLGPSPKQYARPEYPLPHLKVGDEVRISLKGREVTLQGLGKTAVRFLMDSQCSVQRFKLPPKGRGRQETGLPWQTL